MNIEVAELGYGLALVGYLGLGLLLLTKWQGRLQGIWLLSAVAITTLWAATGFVAAWKGHFHLFGWGGEVVKVAIWLVFLSRLLRVLTDHDPEYGRSLTRTMQVVGVIAVVLLVNVLVPKGMLGLGELRNNILFVGMLVLNIIGLAFVEQLFRNTPTEHRWGIKNICFALGAVFAFDFYFFTDALLFVRTDTEIWSVRGLVSAMVLPLLGLAAARNPKWSVNLFLSRRLVFHTTALLSAGAYMVVMALFGYYIKLFGGEWGNALRLVFLVGAALVLAMLLFSGQIRSRIKIFFNKHFFTYQYDYREEWLRLIGLLSGKKSEKPIYERVIWALAELMDSSGGVLFLVHPRECRLAARFNHPDVDVPPIPLDDNFIDFLRDQHWVVDLDELAAQAARYDGLRSPAWLSQLKDPWLIVPLVRNELLSGFVVLIRSRAPKALDWENIDLLKTAGMQSASYIALHQAGEALAEARQFEGFNRLSAFVMHDLKNIVAQLSLVAKNAERHKHKPEFQEDAVRTIQHAVERMQRLMKQLKSADILGEAEEIDLVALLKEVTLSRQAAVPVPALELDGKPVRVKGNPDRLFSAISNIVQNAQEATPADGEVVVRLRSDGDQAQLEISDTGVGMAEDFIAHRLFRPFESTKGLTGMGIGAYECRELVRSLGGDAWVESAPGRGTRFKIVLPCARAESHTVTPEESFG